MTHHGIVLHWHCHRNVQQSILVVKKVTNLVPWLLQPHKSQTILLTMVISMHLLKMINGFQYCTTFTLVLHRQRPWDRVQGLFSTKDSGKARNKSRTNQKEAWVPFLQQGVKRTTSEQYSSTSNKHLPRCLWYHWSTAQKITTNQ